MKIAQVSPYDYHAPGGVQEHIAHLARELTALGHEVKILAPSSVDEDELQENVIKVSGAVTPVHYSGSIARLTLSPRVYRRVKRILREEAFDIIHLHEPFTPVLPWAVLRHSKAVNVATFHAYRESHAVYEYGKALFQPFSNRLDGRIAVSTAARDTVAHYFPGDYRVIPNGIDLEQFGPHVPPLERFRDGKLNILFVGRLEQRKGFRTLIRAFPYVKEAIPEARLIVAGGYDKEDKEPFVRYARRHHLHDVKFVGFISTADKPRYFRTAHVFCAPSTGFESFGLVLLEAMASCTPLVASGIAGYRSVMTHGQEGLFVPPSDPRALADALIFLLREQELRERMGNEGRKTAERYAWPRVAHQVVEYYEELLAQRRAMGVRRVERSFREFALQVSSWLDPR